MRLNLIGQTTLKQGRGGEERERGREEKGKKE